MNKTDHRDASIPRLAPHIKVNGTLYECGRACGEASTDRITRSVESYRIMFETCDITWQQAIDKALPCLEIAFKTFPQLEAELQGLADGSGIDLDSLAALNCRTEILPADYLARATGRDNTTLPNGGHLTECTSLALSPASRREQQSTWLAQNWDWIGMQRESLILLEAQHEDDSGYLCVTEAGMLAKIGLNRQGLGISLNILRSANDGLSPGMPVHLFLRGLLECNNVAEATALAESVQFASSSNMMVADSDGNIASIEVAPTGVRILHPTDQQPGHHLCHTNHFLHKDLSGFDAGLTGNLSTEARLQKAQELVGQGVDGQDCDSQGSDSGGHELDSITRLLSDTSNGLQSICRFPDTQLPVSAQVETVVAVAMDLEERRLWLSAAQPSMTPMTPFELH